MCLDFNLLLFRLQQQWW